MTRPDFIRLVPDEIERHGLAAAAVLAHIRFRTGSDGPGRIEHGGERYWRVSQADLGREVGLSRKAVMAALQALGGVVSAEHFSPLSDRSLAYRVLSAADALTSQSPDPDPGWSARSRSRLSQSESGLTRVRNGTMDSPDSDSLPIAQEVEEGERPGSRPAPSPSSDSLQRAGEYPFGPRCARHRLTEHPPACGGCGAADRAAKAAEAAAAAQAEREYAAMLAVVVACPDCDAHGWLTVDGGVADCNRHLTVRSWRRLRPA